MSIIFNHHHWGFFSCCSVKISHIVQHYFLQNKCLPDNVDSSKLFSLYKCVQNADITYDFFDHYENFNQEITCDKHIDINDFNFQFSNYKEVDYKNMISFVKKYFSPSSNILMIENDLILKYNINTENCIGLYFRGTDKAGETELDSFESYYNKLIEIIKLSEQNIQIIIQTDSAYFLDFIKNKGLNIIVIRENDVSYTNRGIHNEKTFNENYIDIQNLFATFLIISKCKYLICSSGNGSIWMMYYRMMYEKPIKNDPIKNVHQNLNKNWL
jgi:hypothetical protein